MGEVQRRRGATDAARNAFRQLAVWAAADPYGDTWGGSGLGALALWRWLQIIDRNGSADPDEVQRASRSPPR